MTSSRLLPLQRRDRSGIAPDSLLGRNDTYPLAENDDRTSSFTYRRIFALGKKDDLKAQQRCVEGHLPPYDAKRTGKDADEIVGVFLIPLSVFSLFLKVNFVNQKLYF